jgi:hypothetical protein
MHSMYVGYAEKVTMVTDSMEKLKKCRRKSVHAHVTHGRGANRVYTEENSS